MDGGESVESRYGFAPGDLIRSVDGMISPQIVVTGPGEWNWPEVSSFIDVEDAFGLCVSVFPHKTPGGADALFVMLPETMGWDIDNNWIKADVTRA